MDKNTSAAHTNEIGEIRSDLGSDIAFNIWQLVSNNKYGFQQHTTQDLKM